MSGADQSPAPDPAAEPDPATAPGPEATAGTAEEPVEPVPPAEVAGDVEVDQEAPAEPEEVPEPAPLLELRDGPSPVVDTFEALVEYSARLAAGSGPVAIDAERASGYRYSARAYLIQLRRTGAGTALLDPIAVPDLEPLSAALGDNQWILHAASQDLPCLTELGLRPQDLFDTELAGRLLGYPRVGLATLVETILGRRMRKEHSAVDWSTRPLPGPWLEYAALDVEVLIELRDVLEAELEETGKAEWARQEFAHLVSSGPPGPKPDPWRRTSGLHKIRGRRTMAAVRALWETRDAIASQRDVTPGKIIPDSAIVEAANAMPADRAALLAVRGFHGRGAERYSNQWVAALKAAKAIPEAELPPLAARYDGPPPPRAWADKDPIAAARLSRARSKLTAVAGELNLPTENLLSPDVVRRVMWEPPAADAADLEDQVVARLVELRARPWQVELTSAVLAEAITHPRRVDATSRPTPAELTPPPAPPTPS